MDADTTKPSSDEAAVATVAGALSRAAIANGARLRGLRAPLARAALDAARPVHYREAADDIEPIHPKAARRCGPSRKTSKTKEPTDG